MAKVAFLGLGVIALPLMSLSVPPLQAAAILIPTMIANAWFMPRHLLPAPAANGVS